MFRYNFLHNKSSREHTSGGNRTTILSIRKKMLPIVPTLIKPPNETSLILVHVYMFAKLNELIRHVKDHPGTYTFR